MFLAYLARLLGPIAVLAESATGLQNQLAGFDRTLDLLNEPVEMPTTPDSVRCRRHGRRADHVDGVSFAYAETRNPSTAMGPPRHRRSSVRWCCTT